MLNFLTIPAVALAILSSQPRSAQLHALGTIHPVRADSSTPAFLDSTEYRRLQVRMSRRFPALMWDAGVSGTVVMRFIVRPDGSIDRRTIRVVQSSDFESPFASVAETVVQPLRFHPATRDGVAVTSTVQAILTFANRGQQEAVFTTVAAESPG